VTVEIERKRIDAFDFGDLDLLGEFAEYTVEILLLKINPSLRVREDSKGEAYCRFEGSEFNIKISF